MLIAGEASGDLLAAELEKQIDFGTQIVGDHNVFQTVAAGAETLKKRGRCRRHATRR